jgi:NitT/TauT family transport system substrate-binding protein
MARLTGFSKLLITVLILAVLFFGGKYLLYSTEFGQDIQKKAEESSENSSDYEAPSSSSTFSGDDEDVLKVQLFTWGGYAPGLYFNNGWEANKRSRFYTDYGLKVKFVLIDDFNASREAWKSDNVHLIGQTADALPTEMEGYAEYDPTVVMQVDWSRGGDALVVQRGINTVNDLRGKKVAVTPLTPSQTFLIKLLDAANMSLSDIEVVETPDNFAAATAFKSGGVAAAVVWAPDDEVSVRDVPGAKILQSTAEASHIIADIFYGKKSFIEANKDKINKFYEGWMIGAAEINANESNKVKASKIMAEGTAYAPEDALFAINKARLTTHGDNMNFFKKNINYKGVSGEDIYTEMGRRFHELGFAPANLPRWQSIIYTGGVMAANSKLTGPAHAAEGEKRFLPPTEQDEVKPAIASKKASISFASGQYVLDSNAKTIIDLQFANIAKSFANSRIRIEGNTDSVGGREMNQKLSRQRAESVAKYLEEAYGMNRNRFIIVGNGPDKPVAGCEQNQNEACKAKNRRTEFQLVS